MPPSISHFSIYLVLEVLASTHSLQLLVLANTQPFRLLVLQVLVSTQLFQLLGLKGLSHSK